ncbi:MAG: hypothetical protein ICV66_10325 [Chitinophagaceae bacterium]|nr:hypothetical protein [Chitinophagaceae bacterium]
MRTANDLQRIIPVIWQELKTLKIPFGRCGVFIVDEVQQQLHLYLSTPDGRSIGALHLPIDDREETRKLIAHWRNGVVYTAQWDREQFLNWTQMMIDAGQVSDRELYQGESSPPESLHLHLVPFAQGMLYIGNTAPLTVDEVELVKALAEAFAIAYARYEDFKQLEKAKSQVDRTLSELKSTQDQLIQKEKMASLGELTAGIAHEIKNPLNFITNFSEVNAELANELLHEIQGGNHTHLVSLAADIQNNAQKITYHGKRADAIVKAMLQHSRKSSGQKEPTNINSLVDEYLRLSYHGLRAKDKSFNATIKTEFDNSIDEVDVVPQDIGRVFLNLFNNSFYSVNEKKQKLDGAFEPTVYVKTERINGQIKITVSDNGTGIPQNIMDKIFQPFFTTKPPGQGTGLGLSLSYDIVRAHGGQLKVNTKEGDFAEFVVQLPISKS